MFELWVPITLAAAFLQNLRSALQKYLKGRLSTAGATMTRFVYAVPFALAYVLVLNRQFDLPWPAVHGVFLGYMAHLSNLWMDRILSKVALNQIFYMLAKVGLEIYMTQRIPHEYYLVFYLLILSDFLVPK